jgi:pimeloyl-ACP methyl ester carboxylesterase
MATSQITLRTLTINGVKLQLAEQGEGPLVLFCHGFPETWRSRRHQLPVVAASGYHAVAPDMRGYGGSDAPADVTRYNILELAGDLVGLVQALGQTQAVLVGHDWGATVAWMAALIRPDVFSALVGMSVPYRPRGAAEPLQLLRSAGLDAFYYFYFQEPGAAEAEFERDVDDTMRRILFTLSGDMPESAPVSPMLKPGAGFLGETVRPVVLPPWLTEEDLTLTVAAFQRTGFRGGLNYYRNIDANWRLTAPFERLAISQPVLFIAGARDVMITMPTGRLAFDRMPSTVPGLKDARLVEGAGHWIQQERPAEVNAALISFLCHSCSVRFSK